MKLAACQRFDPLSAPMDWVVEPIKRRLCLEYGSSLTEDVRRAGSVPVFGSNGCVGTHDTARVEGPGILVGRKGSVGEIHFSESEFWPIDTVYYVRRLGQDDWGFLYYLLGFLNLDRLNAATGVPGLTRRDAHDILGAFPDLEEQRRIAAALKLADAAIQKAREELDAARRLRKSAASELLQKGMPGRHTDFQPTKHWTCPASWDLVCVKHLLADMDAGSSPMCEADPARPGQWGVLKVSAISWDRFDEMENKALPPTIEPALAAEVRVGDIIVSRANTTELCGAVHRVQSLYTRLLLCDKTWRLHPKEEVNPDWLVAILKHPHARRQIEANATGTSDSMKNIAKRDFRNVVVPRPSKTEQKEIARVLNTIDAQSDALKDKVGALIEAKRSVLQNLLTGKIRIPSSIPTGA